jgi:cytochrome P450
MIRFGKEPTIPSLLQSRPDLIPSAVEELLRLEGPFIAIGRTATCDTEIGGQSIAAGEKVILYWASANRDEGEFPGAAEFQLDRSSNRHVAFGVGPHRCAGSNLARLNLKVALEELTQRLRGVTLAVEEAKIPFHSALNRSPLSLPIQFEPGVRLES